VIPFLPSRGPQFQLKSGIFVDFFFYDLLL
jgi:hypothetical protein